MERASSRIIKIPENVQVNITNKIVEIIGPKGNLNIDSFAKIKGVKIIKKDNQIFTEIDSKKELKFAGTIIALISNGIAGVQIQHQKTLKIKGGGYKALIEGQKVKFFLGKSHSDELVIPQDLEITCPSGDEIIIKGVSKERVGLVAKKIISLRKHNPYKLKGIYENLNVKLKPGKTANK